MNDNKVIKKKVIKAKSYVQTDLDKTELYSFAQGTVCLYTHRAPHKESPNEDTLSLIPVDNKNGVLVVADGVGGMPTGQDASRIAIESITNSINKAVRNDVPLREGILNGIEHANKRICESASGSATTLAVIEIQGNIVRSYHVGDVLVLLTGQRGKLKLQNVPHSPVGYAVESGLLDEAEAVLHEERNIVSNVIGSQDMRIEIGPSIKLSQKDSLIIASDGLPDNLYINEIVETIRKGPLKTVASKLVSGSRERMEHHEENQPHHPDDLTFILYRPR